MLLFMLCSVFIFIPASCTQYSSNVGSILFNNKNSVRDCWNQEDLAKLKARRVFENISLPLIVSCEKIDSKYIKDIIKYFRRALRLVDEDNEDSSHVLKQALADVIGGHLQSRILPNVRLAYYAGYVPYRNARQIHDFFDEIKSLLNTQGLGWRRAPRVPQQSNLTVSKIVIGSGKLFDPCSGLITKHDMNGCIHLPYPKLDDEGAPSAIALPFKSGGLVSLGSPRSENVLLKYYTTACRCILNNSPEKCRHSDFVSFNNELLNWMKREVAPHLVDDKLYAAYGGVLRVAAAVQNYGKGLPRRNLYECEAEEQVKWHPWRALTQNKLYLNGDWTPQLYVTVVIVLIILMSLMQMSYSYIFGDMCSCKDHKLTQDAQDKPPEQVSFARTGGSSFHRPVPLATSDRRAKSATERSRPDRDGDDMTSKHQKPKASTNVRTHRVYDMNENTEKLMSVIMSDYEGSIISAGSSASDASDTEEVVIKAPFFSSSSKPSSPPKIQAPIQQLKLIKHCRSEPSEIPMYTTSTVSRSEITYCRGRLTEQGTTYTSSTCSSSEESSSSASVAHTPTQTHSMSSHTRQSKRSRDIAWARRVISQTTRREATSNSHSTTATELELNSYTTPPSRASKK